MDSQTHELLDAPPPALARPLSLVDAHAYAATWLYVRTTDPPAPLPPSPPSLSGATAPPDGRDPPRADAPPSPGGPPPSRVSRRLFVLRDDGRLFGPAADAPLHALGLDVDLDQVPDDRQLWRRHAVDRYRRGQRPDPADLFAGLVSVYDAFVDFDRSLADQRTMCELCACCSLATWLLDAFPLAPYLWFSGERGSGKTKLGTIWARTSYLGEVVLAAGTFSALRDLARYGASLYFDDAEAFGGGRRGDRDKRDLLLAGNRRGARAPLKTFVDGHWQTRLASTFTARAFSAISLPEPTLASRAVVVPLTRSLDSARAARDVADESNWPCDPRGLLDDLWAFGLAFLSRARACCRDLEPDPVVVGREFEKWRPILAVARLFADHGRPDLEPRLRALMAAYQSERPTLAADDETLDVIHGLLHGGELWIDRWRGRADPAQFRAWTVDAPNRLIVDLAAYASGRPREAETRGYSTRIGQVMARLRFRPLRNLGPERQRGWRLSLAQILAVARAYGVEVPPALSETPETPETPPPAYAAASRPRPPHRRPRNRQERA